MFATGKDVGVAETTVLLFSCGTLRQENVQLASFRRILSGSPDALPGYATTMIEITDPEVVAKSGMKFHPMVVETGNPSDEVPGTLSSSTRRSSRPLLPTKCPTTDELKSH
jgi:hypothetical protein